MNIAILHDRFPGIGGGERFVIEAARVLDCPIYTMYVARGVEVPDDVEIVPIKQRKYTGLVTRHFLEWKNAGMNPLETLNVMLDMTDAGGELSEYDVVLESAPLSKSYVPRTGQTVIQYPHSPPRWLYDLYQTRLGGLDYPIIGSIIRLYADVHRSLDIARNNYVDGFIANSEVVADRIERYYGREAAVVYPPVRGDWRDDGDDGYFVTWSRLTPDKRIELIVDAFRGLDAELKIAGEGPERRRLEPGSPDNVEWMGFVDDIESVVSRASAVVYAPRSEDFGLVGAEALLAGKPLIGVDEGYTAYQVEEGVTGTKFEPTVFGLRRAIDGFDPGDYDTETIAQIGKKYRIDFFRPKLRAAIMSVVG